ncbi:MAG TPA: CotH kinase family protein [Anaerolineae bacterium]|nr:CotH kinase family protein [Anaerolineae bacterium]HQI85116.1 CotH kinase family protein [Anaerolineae bacterium]
MISAHIRRWLPLSALLAAAVMLLALSEALAGHVTDNLSAVSGINAPTFAPAPGVYQRSIRVTLRATHPRGQIVYTIDGTLPTPEIGLLYEHPLRLDGVSPRVVVIRAVEIVDGVPGPVVNATYIMGVPSKLPIVSLIADPAALWDAEKGIFANTWGRGADWERPVAVTYIPPDGTPGFALSAGLRIHGADPAGAAKQSLRLYFRSEYNAARLEYQLFAAHPQQPDTAQTYKRLLLQTGDRAGRWTFFRDQLVVDVATAMGLPAAQGRFVHLFLNGESWGLYRLSERIDRFFLDMNLGIAGADLVQNGRQREGDDAGWDALVDWIAAHSLAEPDNFSYVADQVDLDNLTDWAVLQLYFGFPASEMYAAHPPGGPWFFLYAGGSQSFASRADAPLFQEPRADFTILLRALLKNPGYRARLARRLAMLLNTTLAAPALQSRAQALVATLHDDIRYEAARWPTPFLWADNVDAFLTDFTVNRPAWVLKHLANAWAIGEVASVSLEVQPPEAGYVYIEGARLPGPGVWEGDILSGVPVQFTAVPAREFVFTGWMLTMDGAASTSTNITLTVAGPCRLVAHFAPPERTNEGNVRPDDVVINEFWINDNGTPYASVGNRPIDGDWIELLVQRDGVDLRGWRLTDNNTKIGAAEGSLIFPALDALAAVPRNTIILILATESDRNAHDFPKDDLDPRDKRLLFYVGNGALDVTTDPGFGLGTGDDNLVLLAPGPTAAFDDDIGVDFVAEGYAVTPYTFGILADGVTFDRPFRKLGADDGALFVGMGSNDALADWIADPPASQSGDEVRADSPNIVTPGTRNPPQRFPLLPLR